MRRKLSRIALTCCAALTLAVGSGCASDGWPSGQFVQIGVKSDQPGTGYMGAYPPRSGFDIKIAGVAADALGKSPKFQSVPSQERQTDLDGKHGVDLVVATYSINNDRLTGRNGLPANDFAGPYAITYQGFLVRRKGPRIRTLDDLRGRKVCTWAGTTSGTAIDQRTTGLVPIPADDALGCVRALRDGRADAVSTDQMLLYGFTQFYQDLEVVPGLTIGDAQYYGVGLPKGHRKACGAIEDALKKYVNSNNWTRDFKDELPAVPAADPNWENDYKPTDTQIDTYSCRDKIGS